MQVEQLSVDIPCLSKGQELCEFVIGEVISEGRFGRIYQAHSPKFGNAAVKVKVLDMADQARMEMSTFLALDGHRSFPQYYGSGKNEICNFLVMELLGLDLERLMKTAPDGKFSPKSWSRLAIQALYAVKALHSFGYLHRDIKLSNFALTLDRVYENPHIKLIGFGLCRKFVERHLPSKLGIKMPPKDPNKTKYIGVPDIEFPIPVYRMPRKHAQFHGSPLYASFRGHEESELGRGDDVLSLMYLIADLVEPLPWSDKKSDQMLEMKKNTCISTLFSKLFGGKFTEQLKEIDSMLKKADYFNPPDYWMIFKFLKNVMDDSGASWTSDYDWKVEYAKGDIQPAAIRYLQQAPWEHSPEEFQDPDFPEILAMEGGANGEKKKKK